MLASITPLGERGRGRSWNRTVVAFFAGAALGGGALGGVLALIAWLASPWPGALRWTLVAAAALVVVLLESVRRLPTGRRQVDVRWLDDYRGWVVGLGYGTQLGVGVVTIIPTAATWVVMLVAVGSADPLVALMLGLLFGVTRTLPLLATARVTTPAAVRDLHRRLAALAGPADRMTRLSTWVATCGVLAVAAGLAVA